MAAIDEVELGLTHLLAVHYLRAVGAKALLVANKVSVQLMPDLISGELRFNLGPLAPALPHVRRGKLQLVATLPDRSDATPGVSSLADPAVRAGMEAQGFHVAGGTPDQMAQAIEAATVTWRQFVREYDIPQE